jgi:DNA-binding MurR/RpiR family transcriptional regulator
MPGSRVTSTDDTADATAEVIRDLRRRIRERWEGFSPAARAVCRALSERSAEQLVFVSALELGAETKTSNATVVRTVQALGYSGLAELKAKLAEPFAGARLVEQRTRRRMESAGHDVQEVWGHVLTETDERLDQLRQAFSPEAYDHAVQLLLDAQEVVSYGFGALTVAAEHLYLRLARMGVRSRYIGSSGFRLADDLLGIEANDVVVLFAPARMPTDVEVLIDQCRAVGVPTVLVTEDLGSQIAAEVTVVLYAPTTATGLTSEPLTSIIVADVLSQCVSAADVDRTVGASHRLSTLREQLGFG